MLYAGSLLWDLKTAFIDESMGRRKKVGVYIGILGILVTVAAVLCIVLLVLMYMDNHGMLGKTDEAAGQQQEEASDNVVNESDEALNESVDTMPDEPTDQMPEEIQADDEALSGSDQSLDIMPMHDDVDIARLQSEVNPDIYSWIYIPQSGIDAPILQNNEDGYYLKHNEKGEPDADGAIYTLALNKKDFSDNVTVVYGYNDGSEEGFSNLDLFADPVFFQNHPFIYVYTEDSLLVYQVYAAYESDDRDILEYYQPFDEYKYGVYIFESVQSLGLSGNARMELWPETEDRIITLSTVLKDKEGRRYLVQAKLSGVSKIVN